MKFKRQYLVLFFLIVLLACRQENKEYSVDDLTQEEMFLAVPGKDHPHTAHITLRGAMHDSFQILVHNPSFKMPEEHEFTGLEGEETFYFEWYGELNFSYMPDNKPEFSEDDNLGIVVRFEYY